MLLVEGGWLPATQFRLRPMLRRCESEIPDLAAFPGSSGNGAEARLLTGTTNVSRVRRPPWPVKTSNPLRNPLASRVLRGFEPEHLFPCHRSTLLRTVPPKDSHHHPAQSQDQGQGEGQEGHSERKNNHRRQNRQQNAERLSLERESESWMRDLFFAISHLVNRGWSFILNTDRRRRATRHRQR